MPNTSSFTLNLKGRIIDLARPRVMGILNVTPDSFYDGSKWTEVDAALYQTEKMLEEGADILDIGGVSSRPNAAKVGEDEELQRVLPIVEAILKRFPEVLLSIDTFRGRVAKESIAAGAALINDISAGAFDATLLPIVAQLKVPYVLMHMQGTPQTMQNDPKYTSLINDILDFHIQKIAEIRTLGIEDLIIDLGFGFGKTIEDNYELLNKMHLFQILGLPILAGLSRKSMIWKVLGSSPKLALNGTTALNMVALQQGARILRVHDVKPAVETIQLYQQLVH
ncbi:MAG: dihydropteroate synthase [Saprospiraceae bacterium]|nr:dihydropteroate synthase [Saprospiraceae bacterium]